MKIGNGKKAKKVKIDGIAIKKWAKQNGMTLSDLSLRLGKCSSYMSVIIHDGEMTTYVYNLMLDMFKLPRGSFIKKEPEQKRKAEAEKKTGQAIDGYQITLAVYPDRLKLGMEYQGETMYEAWAYIKGNKEVDLVQSVSYAAHLLYKKAEQKELEG